MKSLHYLLVFLLLCLFSSCEIIREVAQDQLQDNLSCIPPTSSTYNQSLRFVQEKRFEHDRETTAKRETKHLKCMTSNQIRGFVDLLDFEHARLEYAKFAYAFCSDPNRYYSTISPTLDFDSSKQDLEELTR